MSRRLAPIAVLLVVITLGAVPKPAAHTTGEGLVAHEWGTFTSIAGEQGQALEWLPLQAPQFLRQQITFVQFRPHLALRFGFTHPTRQQLLIGFIGMLREFFNDGVLARWRKL